MSERQEPQLQENLLCLIYGFDKSQQWATSAVAQAAHA